MKSRLDARSAGDVSTVAFVAGGVLLAGGTTMFVLAKPRTKTDAGLRAAPLVAQVGWAWASKGRSGERRQPRIHWARVGVLLPFVAAVGCNALIGATDPTGRTDASVACVLNSDGDTGELCIFRVCSPPCRTDADCPTHSRCLVTQAGIACVDNSVATCEVNLPCPMGSECKSGSCRNVCQSADDCLRAQLCLGGACVGTDPSHDTGFDAGPGPVEAGAPLDAGTPLDAPSDQGVDQTTDQAADQTV